MAVNAERARIYLLAAILLGIQVILLILLVLYFTSIQLEMIYPYLTVTTLGWIGIVPAYNLGVVCWSVGIAINEQRAHDKPDHDSRDLNFLRKVHAFACLPCIPFGPIIGTWCFVSAKEKTMDEMTSKTAILLSTLSMFYLTSGAISVILLVIPTILTHQYLDLIYPYSMIVTNPVFMIFGVYCLALIVGDIVTSIACIARKFSPFGEQACTSRFARFLRAWAMFHVIAIPVGPFLAAFYGMATGTSNVVNHEG